jgi:hypothetical protein
MIEEETITLEELQKYYYVNFGFLDENNKELYLICEIIDLKIVINRYDSYVNVYINPIDKDWVKKYLSVYERDEELDLLEKGFEPKLLEECEFIKKQNND